MNNLTSFLNQSSPKKIRTIFFSISMLLFLLSYILLPESGEYGSASSFVSLIAILVLVQSFQYRLKESELSLHTFIRKASPKSFGPTLLFLAISLTIVLIGFYLFTLLGPYTWVQNDPLSQFLSFIFILMMCFTFSLWDRWVLLKKSYAKSNKK